MRILLSLFVLLSSSGCGECQLVRLLSNGIEICGGCHIDDPRGNILTARHCGFPGSVVGADAVITIRNVPDGTPALRLGPSTPGPAEAIIQRGGQAVRVPCRLEDRGYVGHLVSVEFVPLPGDSGSPVVRGDEVIAVVAWRSLDGRLGGFSQVQSVQEREEGGFAPGLQGPSAGCGRSGVVRAAIRRLLRVSRPVRSSSCF